MERECEFINSVYERASKDIKTIVLPESDDDRVIRAATWSLRDNIANIIMVGDEKKVAERAKKLRVDISD
ncbi:MAG: hypothetical protein IJT63_05795, partial [Lachnospiraceae bacterium]|nr:hypothetical protein [Lachnospiraceae bacterium]